MKLAITSTGKDLDSNLDPRFGRAAYFICVDPQTMAFEVVENSQNLNLPRVPEFRPPRPLPIIRWMF